MYLTCTNLYVPGSFLGLVGHPLLYAGQLLLQICHLVLMKFCQVVQLILQMLIPANQNAEIRIEETIFAT